MMLWLPCRMLARTASCSRCFDYSMRDDGNWGRWRRQFWWKQWWSWRWFHVSPGGNWKFVDILNRCKNSVRKSCLLHWNVKTLRDKSKKVTIPEETFVPRFTPSTGSSKVISHPMQDVQDQWQNFSNSKEISVLVQVTWPTYLAFG